MKDLRGARVALLEARMSGELAGLVRRYGGEPRSAPAVREVPLPCAAEVASFIDGLRDGAITVVVFLTGVGASALIDEAERLGRKDELLALFNRAETVARGPKPTAALKKRGVSPKRTVASPFTGNELLAALADLSLENVGVGLVHYGERSAGIADGLVARGATLHELCLYEWQLPEDIAPLVAIARAIAAGEVDVVAFTSQVQVRHLLQVARAEADEAALRAALGGRVVIASVGPTCSAALVAAGLRVDVEPESPKMGPMLDALATFLEARARSDAGGAPTTP